MKTTIKNMRQAITVMSYCLLATGFAACSPDSFDGADPNGRPTVDGVDFQITVDQETNQMVATYKAQPGLYPIWILDGTSYSTLPEVGYKNDEAGTHTIEMKLGNRNGFSHGSIKKTYTFNETKIDYSSDFRRIADKEWRIANKEAGHMGCGPAGTAGTEWWSAAADDKKAFGVYDDRIVLERRDFLSDKSLGDDWVVPFPAQVGGTYSFTRRRAACSAPQFAADATVRIESSNAKNRAGREKPAVTVTFPPANVGTGRVYYYEIAAMDMSGGEIVTKRVLSEGWCDPVGGPRYVKDVRCVFAEDELPPRIGSFRVRPVGFFGAKGRVIESKG